MNRSFTDGSWTSHPKLNEFRICILWPQNDVTAQKRAPDQYNTGQHPNFWKNKIIIFYYFVNRK